MLIYSNVNMPQDNMKSRENNTNNVCLNCFISGNFLLRSLVFYCPFPRCSTVALILWFVNEIEIYLII